MTISFYISGELNGFSFVKNPFRSSALVNIKNDDKYCFVLSIWASLRPCNINPNRVSIYKQYFNELNIQGFDFTNGFKCGDIHKFEKLNNLSIIIHELNFYKYNNKWKHKLIPIEISENNTDNRVFDLAIYRNQYFLITKFNVFIGEEDNKYICRHCLSSYTSENMMIKHKQHCNQERITNNKTSSELHLYWKYHFHKNPIYFRIYADFEADNEKVNSGKGNKTNNIH